MQMTTLRILCVTSVSACLELNCASAYYAYEDYKVYVNGEFLFEKNTNVFSLFGLESGKNTK